MSAAAAVPQAGSGPVFVGAVDGHAKLAVARFEGPGDPAVVKPDLRACSLPLRLAERAGERTIASMTAAHVAGTKDDDAPKQLELADAAGKNAFIGTKEHLESNYREHLGWLV